MESLKDSLKNTACKDFNKGDKIAANCSGKNATEPQKDIFITINKTIKFLQEALAKTFQF